MVFEHVDDEQFARVCKNAFWFLKEGGVFAFVVTHPDKMTDMDGNLVTTWGAFKTTAPWGGVLDNWRRGVEDTAAMVKAAGFDIELTEELPFPTTAPEGLSSEESATFAQNSEKYRRYPAIRLAVKAIKRLS
jgi:hypothetical protein